MREQNHATIKLHLGRTMLQFTEGLLMPDSQCSRCVYGNGKCNAALRLVHTLVGDAYPCRQSRQKRQTTLAEMGVQ